MTRTLKCWYSFEISLLRTPTVLTYTEGNTRDTQFDLATDKLGLVLHISERIVDGFAVLPKRWIVERSFAWLGAFRRLSKDFEILTGTAENVIRIAMLRTALAKRV